MAKCMLGDSKKTAPRMKEEEQIKGGKQDAIEQDLRCR